MLAFRTNCTLPLEKVHFVSGPNVRGTLDIVWSCLSVIFLCTWSILHLNVPTQSTPSKQKDPGFSIKKFWDQRFSRTLHRLRKKFQWMFITFVFPEQLLVLAWIEWQQVSSFTKRFEEFADNDNVQWTRSHIHYANMGGFHIQFISSPEVGVDCDLESHEAPPARMSDVPSSSNLNENYEMDLISSQRNEVERRDKSRSSGNMSRSDPTGSQQQSPIIFPHAGDIHLPISDESSLLERTGPSRPRLPEYIRKEFEDRFEKDLVFLKKQEEYVEILATKIGDLGWKPDSSNTRIMQQAFSNLDLRQFPEGSERNHFRPAYRAWIYNMHRLRGTYWVPSAYQLLLAREFGIIEYLPSLSEDSLHDHNKGGSIITVFALLQIFG
ncbi:hypothetical protein DM02DRAFT_124392 [Periconia macrospinosa]|uniref:Uncharacterized protein n=1 Tax=Periconia macrospinosa TaxID=97972 RepID=A0A2V1DE53_9PLEO|nr:hypothetical protein DM02DRAFT_124392 [Periconia macrospinosa]